MTEHPVFFMQVKCSCAVIDSQKMNFLLSSKESMHMFPLGKIFILTLTKMLYYISLMETITC